MVEPLSGTKADGQIILDIMNRMNVDKYPVDYHPQWVLDEIAQIIPFFAGVTWQKLGSNGMQWPVDKDGIETQILHQVSFKHGLGQFNYKPFVETNELIQHSEKFPYILTTNRKLEHYNCGAMTRRTGNLELLTEDILLINPQDARDNFIKTGDMVCVTSPRGKVDIRAEVTQEVKAGVMSTTFHFPEIMVNNLTSDEHDADAKCPEYKVVAVKIRKSKGQHKMMAM